MSTRDSFVLSVKDVVDLEQQIEANGIPLATLMRTAGQSVAAAAMEQVKPGELVTIFCGSGNNGGDGWVAAEALVLAGYRVNLVAPTPVEDIKAQPSRDVATEIFSRFCVLAKGSEAKDAPNTATPPLPQGETAHIHVFINPEPLELAPLLEDSCCVIDAQLGAGFSGDSVREPLSTWINTINAYRRRYEDCFVLAVDVPSGLSAQTGIAAEPCTIADKTVTMLTLKPGLLAQDAAHYCGKLELARLIDLTPYRNWLEQRDLA